MGCVECDRLRRQLHEATDELQAWRAQSRDEVVAELDFDRLQRWRTAYPRCGERGVLILMALVARAGRVCTQEHLLMASSTAARALETEDIQLKTVMVHVCKVRATLRAAALAGRLPATFDTPSAAIDTAWGIGYSITPENAALLRTVVGEA